MNALDLAAFEETPLTSKPFDFVVVPDFVKPGALDAVIADFPEISHPGLSPLSELSYGPAFAALVGEIRSDAFEEAFSDKFGVDLSEFPLMITVRAQCQPRDGRIHTDTASKVVTGILYLNEPWQPAGGRLRLLNGPEDIDDFAAEASPGGGTLACFRRSTHSYHGHKPFTGIRRYVMFNWMTDEAVMAREIARHRFSTKVKRFINFF